MFHTRILPEGHSRLWIAHGDPIPGVHTSRHPIADHDDALRLAAFTRPLCRAEVADAPLRPLEHGVALVQPTCDPKMVKRSFWAARPKFAPWPDEPTEDHCRPLDPGLAARWRRL